MLTAEMKTNIARRAARYKAKQAYRGRKRMFKDQEFKEIIKRSLNILHAAQLLKCSTATIYKHCRRLQIEPPAKAKYRERSEYLVSAYRGRKTIKETAKQEGVSTSTLRYHFTVWVGETWNDPRHPAYWYAVPMSLREVKYVNELLDDDSLFDDPEKLAELTGSPPYLAREYVQRSYDRMKRKARNPAPIVHPKRGRRAKAFAMPTPILKMKAGGRHPKPRRTVGGMG